MSNSIDDLILGKIGKTSKVASDDLFDELGAVESEEAPAKPARAKGSTKKAAGAVRGAMMALEPDADLEVADDATAADDSDSDDGFDPERLEQISRPSGHKYQPRILSDTHTDVETLRACRESGISVLLAGFPGCGKTALVEAAFAGGEEADSDNPDLYTVEGTGDTEVADFIGGYVPDIGTDGNVTYRWQDGPLLLAMKEGKTLLIDDCTLIDARVMAKLYPAMDGRNEVRVTQHEGEVVKAAEGFYVIGAHNPGAPGAVLSEALASRFGVHIEVESDLTLAVRLGIQRNIVRVAAALRTQRKQGIITWAPEMRELLTFQKVSKTLGKKVAANNLVASAPEECREDVAKLLKKAFPEVESLRLGSD